MLVGVYINTFGKDVADQICSGGHGFLLLVDLVELSRFLHLKLKIIKFSPSVAFI